MDRGYFIIGCDVDAAKARKAWRRIKSQTKHVSNSFYVIHDLQRIEREANWFSWFLKRENRPSLEK